MFLFVLVIEYSFIVMLLVYVRLLVVEVLLMLL